MRLPPFNNMYENAEFLDEGGFGFVVKATNIKNGQVVALKFMDKIDDRHNNRHLGGEIDAQIITHPNVVKLLDSMLNVQVSAGMVHQDMYYTMY